MTDKERRIDFEQELYNAFGQVKDFTLGMRIAKHFYEMGCKRGAELQRQDLPKWKKTPTGGCWSGEIGVRPTARLFTYEHYSINADKLFEQLEKED